MARPGTPTPSRIPPLTVLRAGAIVSAVVSGALALLAFIFGSPLQFGVALAICAGWWIADDFAVSALGGRRAAARRPAAVRRGGAVYAANHPVFAERRPTRSEHRPGGTSLAA